MNAAEQIQEQMGVGNALFSKQLKGNVSWDELANGFENALRDQIGNSSIYIRDTVQLVKAEKVDTPEFDALSMGSMRDLKSYASRFGSLVQRRADRTGKISSPEEYAEYLAIGLELTSMSEEIQTVVGHTLINITEFRHVAAEKARERLTAQEQADTQDVTDVTPKDVEPTAQPTIQ